MTIDGTGFQIPQKGIAKKGNAFESHKYAGKSTLRYELGVCNKPLNHGIGGILIPPKNGATR